MSLLAAFFIASTAANAAQSVEDIYLKWQPSAAYVVTGQDEPGYRNWYMASPRNAAYVTAFNKYLLTYGVAGVVPTWQLLRTASQWHRCGGAPFEVPPTDEWPNLVWTLRYVRDQVVPTVGPVEVVSGYRNPALNHCAGGAKESVHQHFSALDLVPLRPTSRDDLIVRLCAMHVASGQRYAVGLGFYSKLRFHVDSWKFRTWGRNEGGGLACPASYALAHRAAPLLNQEPDIPDSGSPTVPQATPAATAAVPAAAQPPAGAAAPPTDHTSSPQN